MGDCTSGTWFSNMDFSADCRFCRNSFALHLFVGCDNFLLGCFWLIYWLCSWKHCICYCFCCCWQRPHRYCHGQCRTCLRGTFYLPVLWLQRSHKRHFATYKEDLFGNKKKFSEKGGSIMKKSTKIWLITATSLVALGCIIFSVVMTRNHWDFTKLSTVFNSRRL